LTQRKEEEEEEEEGKRRIYGMRVVNMQVSVRD